MAALAVTQTVGYGVLYYAFAVVLAPLAADLRVSTTTITGALTLAVLVSAVCAIPVGRWLDDHGGRAMMITGSILGAFAVAAWSQVQTLAQLYLVFAGIGIASAMALYEATFALLVAVLDPWRRAKAILTVTIVAGFASSVFVPLTGVLVEEHGWRTAVLILSGIHAAVTIPLHTLALRDARSSQTASPATPRGDRGDNAVQAAACDKSFWLLTGAFVFQGAALAVMAVHLVAYLMSVGHTPTFAAAVAGLLGILSVAGRIAMAGLSRRRTVSAVTATMFAMQGIAAVGLILIGRNGPGAVASVAAFGLGFGVATIARPAIVAERYGVNGYATLAGILATPTTLAKAGAPLGAAALAASAGYFVVMAVIAAACLTAAVCLAALPASMSPPGSDAGRALTTLGPRRPHRGQRRHSHASVAWPADGRAQGRRGGQSGPAARAYEPVNTRSCQPKRPEM